MCLAPPYCLAVFCLSSAFRLRPLATLAATQALACLLALDALCCCRGYQQKNMASYISDVTLKQEETAFVLHACYWHAGPGDAKVRVGGPVICLLDCAAAVAAIHRGATLLHASAPDRAEPPCPACRVCLLWLPPPSLSSMCSFGLTTWHT